MKNIISILVAVLLSVSSVIAQNNNIVCIKDLLNSPSNNPVPTTMGLNEVYVTLSGDLLTPSEIVAPRLKFSRNFMFTPQVKFIIQPYENQFGNISIYNTFNTLFGTVLPPYTSFNLEIDFQDGKGFQLVSPLGMTYTANYVGSEGKKSIEARTKLINSFGIGVLGKSSNFEFTAKKAIKPYEKPSAIWEVNLQNSIYLTASNGKFVPPSYAAAAYNSGAASNPNDPFYKYLNPSSGKAHIYIKYGKNSDGSVRTKLCVPQFLLTVLISMKALS